MEENEELEPCGWPMNAVLTWPEEQDWSGKDAMCPADPSGGAKPPETPADTLTESRPGTHSAAETLSREARFTAMIERHATHLFRVANSLLRNAHDAEDAVQDALLKVYRGDAWLDLREERAFLARTVWRAALDRLPHAGRSMEDVSGMQLQSSGAGPEQRVAEGDASALLRELIDALPEDLRQPLMLSALNEMNSREIAAILGIPEGTVRTRQMRARTELKASYEARIGGRR
jgi:RNA polymerase sigma-70 factor (ECF subfamily)